MLLMLNNKYRRSGNRQRGIGLLELMLSLSIIALLLIMATRYYSSASRSQQVTSALSAMHVIGAAIISYQGQTGTAPTSLQDLYNKRLIPVEMSTSTGANPWLGTVSITSNTVTFGNVPPDACIQLAATLGTNKGSCESGNSVVYTLNPVSKP